jgi:CheY-like chemotaxis protein
MPDPSLGRQTRRENVPHDPNRTNPSVSDWLGTGDHALQEILILVVEDDPFIQMIIEQTLHDGGYSTCIAASGEEALAMLETNAGYRAVSTDISLGGAATGWDVAQRARELIPDVPVLYITSTATAEWTVRGVLRSVLVQKPFAPAQIIAGMSKLLKHR